MKSQTSSNAASETEQITLRAYEIWVAQGRPTGRAIEHWVQAEQEIRKPGGSGARATSPAAPAATDSRKASTPQAASSRR